VSTPRDPDRDEAEPLIVAAGHAVMPAPKRRRPPCGRSGRMPSAVGALGPMPRPRACSSGWGGPPPPTPRAGPPGLNDALVALRVRGINDAWDQCAA
jgi:hypothetical protein